jgi:hypothetical protein
MNSAHLRGINATWELVRTPTFRQSSLKARGALREFLLEQADTAKWAIKRHGGQRREPRVSVYDIHVWKISLQSHTEAVAFLINTQQNKSSQLDVKQLNSLLINCAM